MNIEKHHELAQAKQSQHRQFLAWLKKKKPKDLDVVARDTHDEVFEEIDCLTCANCCKTTGPLFTERDIERIASHLKLSPGKFIEQYLHRDEDGDWVLQSVPCTFLGHDNYCMIYDVRPKACAEFPHTDRRKLYQINNLTIKNTLICPAAYEVVERMKELYNK
ncbi:YkgJ family cysteine cluster protein [Weeksellaceae bacterium KMM 9724]|uniref:YkgJ family cysteine cluster protein n=1 Tax=Profundicola chukchiensis TaxID=2961959 RepID=UPI002438811A|nr:YkgJ family cysteine cluster protein [Profundicola chukchiensis]MDG4950364.1 YkgJ family cysteine cluster protein [Profundicola chukchiensis]